MINAGARPAKLGALIGDNFQLYFSPGSVQKTAVDTWIQAYNTTYVVELFGSGVSHQVSVEILHPLPRQRFSELHLPLGFVRAVRSDLACRVEDV